MDIIYIEALFIEDIWTWASRTLGIVKYPFSILMIIPHELLSLTMAISACWYSLLFTLSYSFDDILLISDAQMAKDIAFMILKTFENIDRHSVPSFHYRYTKITTSNNYTQYQNSSLFSKLSGMFDIITSRWPYKLESLTHGNAKNANVT